MRIAVLMPMDSPFASWGQTRGIEHTLRRMGYETLPVSLPTEPNPSKQMLNSVKQNVPPLSEIAKCDAVLVSGPEHIGPWIAEVYERYEWHSITDNLPTGAWLHESCEREDYSIDFESIQWMARDWFFPAIQDAEKHDQSMFALDHSHYCPFAVDSVIFDDDEREVRTFPVAFIGLLYPKRVAYLNALAQHSIPAIRFGKVMIEDLHGYRSEETTLRYADNLRDIKVFFNLPAMSRLVVSKVFEVMACGALCVTPMLPPEGGVSKNMALFGAGQELIYYRPSHLAGVGAILRDWSGPERYLDRQRITAAAVRKIKEKHTLEVRLAEMFQRMGVAAKLVVQ